MKGSMYKSGKRAVAFLLAFFMMISTALQCDVMKVNAAEVAVAITECGGYEEGAYAEWTSVEGADGYRAYVSKDGTSYTAIDNELIREYADYWRVDTVGLAAGTYYLKVEAVKVDAETKEASVLASAVTGALSVTNYDRSGFAFSGDSRLGTGSGAYNEDGTLKNGAQVVYVTADTAKTCTAVVNGTEQTGIQAILDAKQKKGTENDILCIRIIGCVKADDVDKFSSSSEGIQIKGKSEYNAMNITIEGIGEDATVSGFGFLVRNAGNVEFRNFAIMNFMDDGISLDTKNTNIWVHDMDFFYGSTGGDADQAKGDGTVDMKGDSQYITVSYNHFWDAGKASLCGMKSETGENFITYHHNWFDHSDSRHPRIRTMSVHVYNNYYDGNSKYGVGAAYQSQAFVEANYFNNCKYPMLISKQGSDVATDDKGTFSGEDGGIIKAYNNIVVGAQRLVYANSDAGTGAADAVEFDAYFASTRAEQVPATYAAKQGGKVYNNFDTNVDLGVEEAAIDAPEDVPAVVSAKAGRLSGGDFQWDLSAESEDTNYAVISELKSAIVNYKSSVVSIGGVSANIATDGDNDNTGSEGGDSTGGEGDDDTEPEETVAPSQPVTGAQIHNFTENGKESSFFTISGNLSTSKGTVTYNGLTLTQCLKMESATNISFASDVAGTLTLVFKESAKKVKVDGNKYTLESNVLTVDLEEGTHTITKGDSINLYYMMFAPEGAEEPVATATPKPTEAPTEAPTATPEPTVEPTEVPTATPEPTLEPTEVPTATPEPTVEPTEVPTATPEPTEAPTEAPIVTEAPTVSGGDVEGYVQNFTESGLNSDFYAISGNLSTSKGTVEYNGLTLTTCLKMETETSISFTAPKAGTLTMVFDATAKKIKVDGQKYVLDSNVFTIELEAGEHTVTKGDSMNLFYMVFVPNASEEPAVTATPAPTEAPTEAPTATPEPTVAPTEAPTATPEPTVAPTEAPTATPEPTVAPTEAPTATPEATAVPTAVPTEVPTATPVATAVPTAVPTEAPTAAPVATAVPTAVPTEAPTAAPVATAVPTVAPTEAPVATSAPTVAATAAPTATPLPTEAPVVTVVQAEEAVATPEPTVVPTEAPTATPEPTVAPTEAPTQAPEVTAEPVEEKGEVVIEEEEVPRAEASTENVQSPSYVLWIAMLAIISIGAGAVCIMWKKNSNKE